MVFPLPAASDMVKALEAIPLWKTITGMPKRLAELEARVKALETSKQAQTGPRPNECPYCGAGMTLTAEKPDPTFGEMGLKQHAFHCDGCGKDVTRMWNPKKGYS